jgi:hypothetical protein
MSRWACLVCHSILAGTLDRRFPGGRREYSEFASKKRSERCVLRFFPIFFGPAGLFSIDVAPPHLLVTRRLAFPAFRPCFRRRRSLRWRLGLLPRAAAGRPSLRSGVGHVVGCGDRVGCGCGCWLWLDVVGCGLDVVVVAVDRCRCRGSRLFGLFG